jgi:hypothetical protein
MNWKVAYALLFALALLIVLPVHSTVNATPAQHVSSHSVLVTDGSPGPPPVPPLGSPQEPLLIADGSPGPPPVPPLARQQEPLFVADGSPGPPPVPPMRLASELKAA